MYSFSVFFDTRTSGSLPRRPTRITLDTSEERAAVDEKACSRCEDVGSSLGVTQCDRVRLSSDAPPLSHMFE